MTAYLTIALFLSTRPAIAGFNDSTADDQQVAYQYLDEVEKAVGTKEFESIPYDIALRFTKTLGSIDRHNLNGPAFIRHLKHVASVQERFYAKEKLTEDEVHSYLRPFRVRYEPTDKADWRLVLAEKFKPLIQKAGSVDAASKIIFGWMNQKLAIIGPSDSYPVPVRDDWDPLKVLKENKGMEIDLAIFGIAALRASGIAARFVWAPALRGEIGGKGWLEFMREDHQWVPWVPTFRKATDHMAELRKQFGDKILFVITKPEAPVELTSNYVETTEITFDTRSQNVTISIMVLGKSGLLAARGNEIGETKSERIARVGRGAAYIAASFGKKGYAILPIIISPLTDKITIRAADGLLSIVELPKK